MNLDTIPAQLKNSARWVTWKLIPDDRRPDKPKKVPFNPKNGKPADSTNPATWAEFDLAVRAAQDRRHDGIGYVFTGDDNVFGGDLDDCLIDGQLAPWAETIVKAMNTYTEVSPSGQGVKFFGVGSLPENIKRFGDRIPETIKPASAPGGIELYKVARYFTVTGQHLPGTPTDVRNVNGALARLVAALAPAEPEHTAEPTARALSSDDEYLAVWAERIIERACETLRLAPEGSLHDTRLAMARLVGGLLPLRLATTDELERRLYDARIPNAHHKTEREAIRDGLAMGEQKTLEPPPPPPQPLYDADGWACCPVHKTRLPAAKNGNGYKCHERDTSTATGWCDFWWKGAGYVPPRTAAETNLVAGELITQAPLAVEAQPTSRIVLYNLKGLRGLPPVSWLVEGEIPASMTTVICGQSQAGKSFFAVDRMLQVARRHPDRAVVYIAPEGGSGYRARVDAWLHHFGGEEPQNIYFILQTVTLLNPQTVDDLVGAISALKPVMVVIDTLARSMIGGDENSAKDIGMFFYHTDLIREATGAAIVVVHHTGKAGSYRGSSALYGSVDSWIDFGNSDGLITVECGKAKDWEPFAPRYYRMVKSGESVVLLPADQVSQRDGQLTEAQRKILETLALEIFTGPGAKRAELVSATSINDLTIFKVLSRLKRDGLISQSKKGDPYFITPSGLAAIKSYHRELRLMRRAEELATDETHQDAQLANSQATSTELVTSSDHELVTSHNLLSIEREQVATSSRDANSSKLEDDEDLFEDDDRQTTENIAETEIESAPPPAAASSGAAGGWPLDWTLLRAEYARGNMAAINVHCGIRRVKVDDVLARLDAEAGHVPQDVDDD